jgi:hypothetical protein
VPKYHTMKAYSDAEVKLSRFFTSVQDGAEVLSPLSSVLCIPARRFSVPTR